MTVGTGARGLFDWERMETCALHLSPHITLHPEARCAARALWYSTWPEVISRVEQMHRDVGGCHRHAVWRMYQADEVFREYGGEGIFPEEQLSECLFWIVMYRQRARLMEGRVKETHQLASLAYSLARRDLFTSRNARADSLALSAATLGNAERLLGNLDRALELTTEARRSLQTINPHVLFHVYSMSANVCLEREGRQTEAEILLNRAYKVAKSNKLVPERFEAITSLCQLRELTGRDYLHLVEGLCTEIDELNRALLEDGTGDLVNARIRNLIHLNKVGALLAFHNGDKALAAFRSLPEMDGYLGRHKRLLQGVCELFVQRNAQAAVSVLNELVDEYRSLGALQNSAYVQLWLARAQLEIGAATQARATATSAAEFFTKSRYVAVARKSAELLRETALLHKQIQQLIETVRSPLAGFRQREGSHSISHLGQWPNQHQHEDPS